MAFSTALSAWQDFFLMTGTAAATLVGLLFVSLSLHVEFLTADGSASLRTMARFTFVSFLSIIVTAFVFLMPRLTPPLAASFLALEGLSHTTSAIRSAKRAWKSPVWPEMGGLSASLSLWRSSQERPCSG